MHSKSFFTTHIISIAIILLLGIFLPAISFAATRQNDKYLSYIEQYSAMAQEQMELHGIPASITLAQGLLESAAGKSYLAQKGNNHFGIKCHKGWTGDTLLRDDDEAAECFRAYMDVRDSFNDHSNFLKKKRYAPLFELDPTDYASWARKLRECGYATDPNYANRLITIIETYALYAYDVDSDSAAEATAEFIRSTLISTHVVRKYRGLHYVIAVPGDTYASIAAEFGVDALSLASHNDALQCETEIKPWEEVYFEEKHCEAPAQLSAITIGEDESIHSISQRLGIKESSLKALNPKAKDRPGTKLKLH